MTANNHPQLEVWLDADLIPNLTRVGTLARDDEYDIGAWEKVAHDLAAKAGIWRNSSAVMVLPNISTAISLSCSGVSHSTS